MQLKNNLEMKDNCKKEDKIITGLFSIVADNTIRFDSVAHGAHISLELWVVQPSLQSLLVLNFALFTDLFNLLRCTIITERSPFSIAQINDFLDKEANMIG